MEKSDARLIDPHDPATALGLLSRLPVPGLTGARLAEAAWAYPLVGLLLGGLAALVGLGAQWLGLPAALCALLALATLIVLSGAMHEDGLADTADGLWGGWTPAARLEIMKDSHIGTYGVIALCLSLAARWTALWLLFEAGPGTAVIALLASGALSRAGMPVLMAALPHARATGLSRSVGLVSRQTAALGAALATLAALLVLGAAFFWPLVWAALAVALIGALARRKIGGQTGDILGASQQVAEIAVLFCLLT